MPTTISGDLINFKVRVNGTANPFKTVVCSENVSFEITNETSERRTNCGPITGISDPTFTASGSAVHELAPSATQVTWNDIKDWQKNKTKLDFTFENDADVAAGITQGEHVSVTGSGFFTQSSYNGSAEADGFGAFDWSFTGTGVLDEFDDES